MRNIRRGLSIVAAILVLSVVDGVSASTPYPPTKTVPIADTYYGTRVADWKRRHGIDPLAARRN